MAVAMHLPEVARRHGCRQCAHAPARRNLIKHVFHCSATASGRDPDFQAPWMLTFDLRERDTIWTDENKVRLLKIVTRDELKLDDDELDSRMLSLLCVVPDIRTAISTMKVQTLVALLKNVDTLPIKLMKLKDIFPTANVSVMAASQPALLLQGVEQTRAAAEQLGRLLEVDSVDRLVEQEPRFLEVDRVEEVLAEMRRLMGSAADVRGMLLRDPSWLLRVERGQKRLGQHPD